MKKEEKIKYYVEKMIEIKNYGDTEAGHGWADTELCNLLESLDVKHKKALEFITADDVKEALNKIKYKLKPLDIVLVKTGKRSMKEAPGPGREVTMWLIEQGIKIMGIDLAGWERALPVMLAEYKSGKPKGQYWQAHLAGREREYCQIEGLTNLDAIPKPYGFKVAVFPIKILAASAAWCRAVAILEE